MRSNPTIKPSIALLSAGYSAKTVGANMRGILDSKGLASLRDVYQYEIIRKGITPKKLADLMKKGLKDQDKKVVALYMDKAEQALEISKEAPDTAIQINLGTELEQLAE